MIVEICNTAQLLGEEMIKLCHLSVLLVVNAVSVYKIFFKIACTRLYTPLCPFVRWLVSLSVGPSQLTFYINFISESHFKSFTSVLSHSKLLCKSRTRLIGVGLVLFLIFIDL